MIRIAKRNIFFLIIFSSCFCRSSFAQNTFPAVVKDSITKEPIAGATIFLQGTMNGTSSDANGKVVLPGVPDGLQTFEINFIGYQKKTIHVKFPVNFVQPFQILLAQSQAELEEIVVSSTRTNSRIEDAPLKLEVLGLEDLTEENSIKPGNVTSILGDISSIQIQQLSPVNTNSVVRMQGLDGKYTLLLRDGMPSYGSLSGGLSLLQIPPVDLKQIEIVKGPSSTLNGGGAIAGQINFISKEPADSTEAIFTLNESDLLETNLNAFVSDRNGKLGYTLVGAFTTQEAVDVNGDDYSDLPQLSSVLVHPRFFYDFDSRTKMNMGFTVSSENRIGGNMEAIKSNFDSTHQFFVNSKSERQAFDFAVSSEMENKNLVSCKGSLNRFSRREYSNQSAMNGVQWNGYSELFYSIPRKNHDLLFGMNYLLDDFDKLSNDTLLTSDYSNSTFGAFSQYSLNLPDKLNLQVGLRGDYHSNYDWFFLPSAALLVHLGDEFSVRASAGSGYKVPDMLDLTTNSYFGNASSPVKNQISLEPEKSTGSTVEWNYHKIINEEVSIFFSQTLFITQIKNGIIEQSDSFYVTYFNNPDMIITKGIDNYFRISWHPYELYLGYTYTIPENEHNAEQKYLTYTPLHRAAATLTGALNEHWGAGVETSYNGYQYRDDGSKTSDYFFMAASVNFTTGHFKFVLNCENLLDYRQTKYESIVSGNPANPTFQKLWAPIDGRVVNFSVMFRI